MSTKSKRKKSTSAEGFINSLLGSEPSFGELVRSLRECDGLSQVDLAEKLGVSKSYLCDVEKSRRLVSIENAAKMAKVMGYSVVSFVESALRDNFEKNNLKLKLHLEAA